MEQETTVEQKSGGQWVKIIIGVTLTTLTLLVCASVVAYVSYTQIVSNSQDTNRAMRAPIFRGAPTYNHIAYIGNDNNVWLVGPDGQQRRQLTTDGGDYRFPTWAPDSRRLAFIGPGEADNTVLYTAPTAEGTESPLVVFADEGSAPFYLYWAPDSQMITFLTQEPTGLAMRQASAGLADQHRILGEGSPFYWVWSPQGDRLLMHVGGSRAVSDEAHISLLTNEVDAERVELNLAPGGFQAPAWSADGQHFFYIAATDDAVDSIYRTDAETLEENVVTNLSGFAYMVLSPTGENLAYLQIERGNRPPFGTAYLVGTDGQGHRQLTERPVGSMYWSPDGRKLALMTLVRGDDGSTAKAGGLAKPLPQGLQLRWWIYDVATEELEPLISFRPTTAFLQTVPYFDQYHLSLTFWSPDSRYLVVTREKVGNPDDGTIFVVDTTTLTEPVEVGEGRLAVWSWE